ncbi:hypothetical protein F383_16917 [Gossypium arboreum]|uniref:Uncharacterized protein n=1 Tax=Gossypium arboreum TaxID=29729 RepID=A0A0B0MF94_GOSAR|nr:hypothetical protein F383_16917 [Gossypium arboreum]
MSGLKFASISGNGPSHVKHPSVLQFFQGTLFFVFRKVKIRPFTLMLTSLMRKGGGMM